MSIPRPVRAPAIDGYQHILGQSLHGAWLDRGLQPLCLLAREHRITLSSLTMQAGIPPSTAHRLLATLESHRFAEFDEDTREWMIGVEAFWTGSGFLKRTHLVDSSRTSCTG